MGGGVVQTLDAVTWKAIGSTGGWVEGYVYLTPNLHNHTGIFIDDPVNKDITASPIHFSGGPATEASLTVCSGISGREEIPHRRGGYLP